MADQEVLLSNAEGTIVAHGPAVLVCDCPSDAPDRAVRGVSAFALAVSIVLAGIVGARAAPWPILLIAATWMTGAAVALALVGRRGRMHGRFRLDFEQGQLIQEGRGFRRSLPIAAIRGVSTPPAADEDDYEAPGFAPRWLLLDLSTGEQLRLGKAPAYALGPALAFLKRAGVDALR